MPLERRRSQEPNPEEFANPRAEKMYWATERLLDEAPETGELRWKNVYNGWKSVKEEFLEAGESIEEAKEIAWETLSFFIVERLADLQIEAIQHNLKNVNHYQFGRELVILGAWSNISSEALDKSSSKFNREPPNPNLPLKDYPSGQLVELGNPNTGIYGHLQALDAAADSKSIAPELKDIILHFADKNSELLEHVIDSWNSHLEEIKDYEGQDPKTVATIHETSYIILALAIADSWGTKDDALLQLHHLQLHHLTEHLQESRQHPNPLINQLNVDALEARTDSFAEEMGFSEQREHRISETTVRRAEKIKVAGNKTFDNRISSSYFSELAGYKQLDFGAIVAWVPDSQFWVGNMIISQAHHEPPRSQSPFVRILNAETPAQAVLGLLEYYQNNSDVIKLPYQTRLSDNHISQALRKLTQEKIVVLKENVSFTRNLGH